MSDAASKRNRRYDVGRGKPPKHSQFKKGQSGNPTGKRKGPAQSAEEVRPDWGLEEFMAGLVSVTVDGSPRWVTRETALELRTYQAAITAEKNSDRVQFFRLLNARRSARRARPDEPLSASDEEMLEEWLDRELEQRSKRRTGGTAEG